MFVASFNVCVADEAQYNNGNMIDKLSDNMKFSIQLLSMRQLFNEDFLLYKENEVLSFHQLSVFKFLFILNCICEVFNTTVCSKKHNINNNHKKKPVINYGVY